MKYLIVSKVDDHVLVPIWRERNTRSAARVFEPHAARAPLAVL